MPMHVGGLQLYKKPEGAGRNYVRDLFELVSRLHSTRLATERPLWEWHLIEGLRDGRIAMYTKLHHSLVDGISAMRLLQSILSSDPDDRGMPSPWAKRPPSS